ncbi:aldose epimerase family protein [uncultured Gilvimarinus sp.]|uniref:aldose epimerase family protein n=1 Tax=uncultured Gilvimarinus sp. TaxID=1689143 RepID=UPI0030EE50C3
MTETFNITQSPFGTLQDGRAVELYTLQNNRGMSVGIITFGGIITSLVCPDRDGRCEDVVLGFDFLAPYETDSPYFGALIGRVGNRLARGRFELDGQSYQLACNENNVSHLHGGECGFDKVLWQAESRITDDAAELVLRYLSVDGDQGYPGNLSVEVVYRLTEDNRLFAEYHATTDAPTPVNLTQHSYFNLAGKGDVLNHELTLNAKAYTPVNEQLIPTGEIASVAGTPFDFRQAKSVGAEITHDDAQLTLAGGYDHNFAIDQAAAGELTRAARVYEPSSGRVMTLHTTEPGVQFYSGNFLDGSLTGKGRAFAHRSGLCLEPQHFPDAPNQPNFADITVRPGQEYRSTLCFSFTTDT